MIFQRGPNDAAGIDGKIQNSENSFLVEPSSASAIAPDCAACKNNLTSLLPHGLRKIVNVRLQTVMLYGMTFNSRPTVSNA